MSHPVHSHYENLKVSRDAPPEVIRAAYKSLSQKYHPDRNPGDKDAERIMVLLNAAYETLSDPVRRREHDQWIAREESRTARSPEPPASDSGAANSGQSKQQPPPPTHGKSAETAGKAAGHFVGAVVGHLFRHWVVYAVALSIAYVSVAPKPAPKPGPKPYLADPQTLVEPSGLRQAAAPIAESRPTYVRPATAPNGQAWPKKAGYLTDTKVLRNGGLSTVTVDNSQNDADVFVKLVSLDLSVGFPVREFFIPAHGMFTLKNVKAGQYDIRYRDLDSGELSRSEAFELQQIETAEGTEYSTITLTLYKVANGNMQTYGLLENEF